MRIFQFFAKKLGGLDVFDGRFLKIFNNKSKNQLRQQVLEGSTQKIMKRVKKIPSS